MPSPTTIPPLLTPSTVGQIETGPLTLTGAPVGGGPITTIDALAYSLPAQSGALLTHIEHWLHRVADPTDFASFTLAAWPGGPTAVECTRSWLVTHLQGAGMPGTYAAYTWRRVRVLPVTGKDALGAWIVPRFSLDTPIPVIKVTNQGAVVAARVTLPVGPPGPAIRRAQHLWKLQEFLQRGSSYAAAPGGGQVSDPTAFVDNDLEDPAYVPNPSLLLDILAVTFLGDPCGFVDEIPSDLA